METTIGILVGAVVTIVAAHYYYRRTFNKELRVFGLLNSLVFAGITPDVRSQLHFKFKEHDVEDLQQIMFLVANTGDRAIRDLIEPLSISLPPNVKILDASIVHREPKDLQSSLRIDNSEDGQRIRLEFPLLNRKEYFVVKLLLSGRLASNRLAFNVLSDDLPRTLNVDSLPPSAFDESGYKFEWPLALLAIGLLAIPVWMAYTLHILRTVMPDLFPYPWATYVFSIDSVIIIAPAILAILLFTLMGLVGLGAAIFGGTFPPPKGPRFPLPKEVREAVYPFRIWRFHPEFGATPVAEEPDVKPVAEEPDVKPVAKEPDVKTTK